MNDTQSTFWNAWNAQYRESRPTNAWVRARGDWALATVREMRLTTPAILEVGCANGWLSEQLADLGKLTAIDLADEVVARAQERLPHIRFIGGDFMTKDLPLGAFDVVVSLETLAHVPDQAGFLARAASLLKPDGKLVLTIQNEFVWRRTKIDRAFDDAPVVKWLSMKELKRLLSPHFQVEFASSLIPSGNLGILRIVNSYYLNRIAARLLGASFVDGVKNRRMLGNTLLIVASRRH